MTKILNGEKYKLQQIVKVEWKKPHILVEYTAFLKRIFCFIIKYCIFTYCIRGTFLNLDIYLYFFHAKRKLITPANRVVVLGAI